MKTYKELKEEVLHKPRRVLFDNDGGDVAIQCKEVTAQELLSKRTVQLVGSGVDTLIYTTRSSGFGQFTHNTINGQLFGVTADRYENNIAHKLVAQGTDCLEIVLNFCHANNLELFWGMRMNDTHDASNQPGPIACFYNNKIKSEHPERLLKNRAKNQKYGAWSAVDYAIEDIREYAYRFVEEICDNYDIDGIELDFFRHPVFFTTTAEGYPATQEECYMMTELMVRIKEYIIRKSVERQRAILFAIKVPDSLDYAKTIGLDLKAWLEKGLPDIIITGGYFKMNDHPYSVLLAKKYDVKYIASLDENRIADEKARADRDSVKCYRARAQTAFSAGADGVFLFNYNANDLRGYSGDNSSVTGDMADPEKMKTKDKDYFVSIRGMGVAAGRNYPYTEFLNIPVLNPAIPAKAGEQGNVIVYIMIGEDVKGNGGKADLCIRWKERPLNAKVFVNGFETVYKNDEGIYSLYEIDPDYLVTGRNDIKVSFMVDARLEDMKISVRYS